MTCYGHTMIQGHTNTATVLESREIYADALVNLLMLDTDWVEGCANQKSNETSLGIVVNVIENQR